MAAEVVEQVEPIEEVKQVRQMEQVEQDPYSDRYLGRTKPQKQREREIRDAERDHLVSVFSKLGDGRANRKAPKEERAAYRKVAAIITQHQDS